MTTPTSGRLVALGDSLSCGVGVGLTLPIEQTWVGRLGTALGLELDVLAAPGRASGEVRREQLPRAVAAPAALATVLIGLNDVVRADFGPAATREHVHAVVDGLCRAHAVVLVARLHDPVSRLPLPAAIRRRYAVRIEQVNEALTSAASSRANARLLDLAAVPALAARAAWAVDRIHPSPYGHQAIAVAAFDALAGHHGAGRAGRPVTPAHPRPPRRLDELWWFAAHGAPWLVGRLPKVLLGPAIEHDGPERDPAGNVREPLAGRGAAGREQLTDRPAVPWAGREPVEMTGAPGVGDVGQHEHAGIGQARADVAHAGAGPGHRERVEDDLKQPAM